MTKHEEIPAEDIEVLSKEEEPKITKIRVSDDDEAPKNPLEQLMSNMEEMRKTKSYGILAFFIALVGIFVQPLFLCTLAILLGIADIFWGSKLTKKMAIAGILLGVLGLLNSW